jgi:hypothetical protein
MEGAPARLPVRSPPEELSDEHPSRRSWPAVSLREVLGALGVYLLVSLVLFGLPVLSDPAHTFVGPPASPDPRFFFWALAWWPHALIHGLNPIWTHAVWAPEGYNLAWATGAPGPSLLMSPITLTAGPVVAYNVVALLACPLSSLTAFALCRRLTGAFLPSLAGGYIFGFSTYQLGHVGLHINLELTFLIPLAVYLVLVRIEGEIAPRTFVVLLTLALVFEFLTSTEVFATLAVFGGLILGLALALAPPARRSDLLGVGRLIVLSLLLTAVVVSPYIWYALAYGVPRRGIDGSDLLSFFVPRLRTLIGSATFFPLTRRFPGAAREDTAYLGLPLIAILIHFAFTQWPRRVTKLLAASLLLIALATLGSRLFVAGRASIPLPWRAIQALPLINNAAPRRFSLYLFLIASVVVALWLDAGRRSLARWGVALAAVVLLFPNFSPDYLHGSAQVRRFFATGDYRHYIRQGTNVLILPSEAPSGFPQAMSMVIQVQADFFFRMGLAYTGPPPPEYARSAILRTLYRGRIPAVGSARLRQFLAEHEVRAIILDRGSALGPRLTALLNAPPKPVDDVLIYEVQPP